MTATLDNFESKLLNMDTIVSDRTSKSRKQLYFPCVAMTLPVEAGVAPVKHLQELTEKITLELSDKYKKERVAPILNKLNDTFLKINYNGTKKSVAIFVSPIHETVIHLDVPLEEAVFTDETFEIRDLLYSLQPSDKYLVLVQSGTSFRMFLGDNNKLMGLKVSIPDNIAAYKNDIAEKIEYFTDTTDRKEIMMDKFIHHIDKELEHVLNLYNLPVFVLGTERMSGHFKKYTHNGNAVLGYIHGNYDEATAYQLANVIGPHLIELRNKENKELSTKIEDALSANRLSIGIEEVWRSAMDKKGKLLIVENNYSYPHTEDEHGNMNTDLENVRPSLIKDAVDVIIEEVLESGGEVKFVDQEMMKDLQHIAMFLYY